MTNLYEEWQKVSQLHTDYRMTAAKKYGVRVPKDALVLPVEDGAFVEVMVWVSTVEAQGKPS